LIGCIGGIKFNFLLHKAAACSLLFCFCAAILPIPVPTFHVADTLTSERFPCRGGSCGCKSAEQCWTNCCCNTPSQRLAWAKKNQVTPPEYAVLEDAPPKKTVQAVCSVEKNTATKGGNLCCSKDSKESPRKSCCEERHYSGIKVDRKCCEAKTAAQKTAADKPTPPKHALVKKERSVVVSMLALKCQGADSVFTQLPWMIPSIRLEPILVDHLDSHHWPFAELLVSVACKPDTPPPRRQFS
jgi:hypothetical protein